MKRALTFIVISLLLFGLVSAKVGMTSRATEDLEDEEDNETKIEEEECEEWSCTQWSACLNGVKTRNCVQNANACSNEQESPKISKTCEEKERINIKQKQTECPEKCECSGSTTKCWLANGTREMTVRAGNSGNIIIQTKGINGSTKVFLYKSDDGKLYGVFKGNKTREVKMLPDQVQERIRERIARQLEDEEIELNEDGTYDYQGKEKARLFAFIPVKVRVMAEIDSETGEIIKLRKAWWAIFTNKEGEEIVGASCGTVTPGYNDECCQNKGYDVWNAETAECEFNSE